MKVNIVIITQSDPFYLAGHIRYLINNLPSGCQVVSTVLFEASPFGVRESFLEKAFRTKNIFGWNFFLRYSIKYLINIMKPWNKMTVVLKTNVIPILRLKKSINHQDSIDLIKSYNPDLLVSIAGNQIFRKNIINLAPMGCINLHSALLPKYRGLFPSFWVLKNTEKETGVSVFFVDEGIDSGPILYQEKISIDYPITLEKLIQKTKDRGMKAIIKSIEKIKNREF